jgi:SecD/SecF fusion protein
MNKPSVWKWLILIGLIAWSLATVLPMSEKINYGLDLQGGTSFLLEVDMAELDEDQRRDAPERALEVIRNRVDALGGTEPIIYLEPQTRRIVVQIPGLDAGARDRAKENIERAAFLEFKLVHEDNEELVRALLDAGEAPPGYKVVDVRGEKFFMRDASLDPEGFTDADLYRARRTFKAPPGHELMLIEEKVGAATVYQPVYVGRRQLSGQHLETAGVQQDTSKIVPSYVVTLRFNSEGAQRFARLTTDYGPNGSLNPRPEGRQLAVILDGTLYSAPVIRTPIYGGSAQIEGNFSFNTAQDLAMVLRAGSLPAPVNVIEERTVDPTLGKDSIDSSKVAVALGAGAVLVFMLAYYLLAGVVANVALVLDMVLLPLGMMTAAGFLGLFTGSGTWTGPVGLPTLTLAGIAGIVLTIGMAVDANVLIFERIREEQRAGKRYRSAVDAGYEKAFSTIFDANITTLLTAVILFWQGSGPIRGFAVTLSAGIIVSMYVALVVTRMMFDLLGAYTNISKIKMLSLVGDTKIDFLNMRNIAVGLSLLVIVGSWAMFLKRGQQNFGVDFTGGSAITYQLGSAERPTMDELRGYLQGEGLAAELQLQQEMVGEHGEARDEFLVVKVPFEDGERLGELISARYSSEVLQVVSTEQVGPQVGKELRRKGIMSILLAMVGIVIYISIRFEFGFAVGAIVALIHDVLVTVGLYCLTGHQLSLSIVAALLTIVGYSVNDTIVVFDRIREDLGLLKGKPYHEIANLSINQTLSRTLLTSLTTLLTVVMLLIFGGGAINDFAWALFIGIIAGTYSTIFIATPVALFWHRGDDPGWSPEKKAA